MDIFEFYKFLSDRFMNFYPDVAFEADRKFNDKLRYLEKEIEQLVDRSFVKSQVVENFEKSVDEKVEELGFKQSDLRIKVNGCMIEKEYKFLRICFIIFDKLELFASFVKHQGNHRIAFNGFIKEINTENQQMVFIDTRPSYEYSIFLEHKDLLEKIVRFIDGELFGDDW